MTVTTAEVKLVTHFGMHLTPNFCLTKLCFKDTVTRAMIKYGVVKYVSPAATQIYVPNLALTLSYVAQKSYLTFQSLSFVIGNMKISPPYFLGLLS